MTITESDAATAPTSWRARTAFGWILTPLVVASVPAAVPDTLLMDAAQGQSDLPIARNDVERPLALHLALYVHAGFGGLALLVSPLQAIRRIRTRAPQARRVIGRIALASITVAGPAALTLAPLQPGRDSRSCRLRHPRRVLARLCCHGLPCDSPGDGAKQRRWALGRRPASTQVGLFDTAEPIAFSREYLVVPIPAWVPNLVVAEIYLRTAERGV